MSLAPRIVDYLAAGGLWNPESMDHDKVRELLREAADEIAAQSLALEEAQRWKAEALTVLEKWHKVGDVLMQTYPLQLGDDIPGMLLAFLEADTEVNSLLDSLHEAKRQLEAADTQRAEARQQIAKIEAELAEAQVSIVVRQHKGEVLKEKLRRTEVRLTVLREALMTYGEHFCDCKSLSGEPCDCGFAALVQGSPTGDDISLLLTKSPTGEPEPGQ